uniref:Reverse transcriptase domain-containing protein n=1 Tax=Tanacetum cinerariifolium TaxID=118510 RepID=A0A6L2M213_TANCI|nr:reverse transcriptase domain-containing protein [Tanacetum cinerariifolium]
MRELRLQGMATRLNYSSEDVDEEREIEAPPGFQLKPLRETKRQTTPGIPLLLVAHLRETEMGMRMMSPREALAAHEILAHEAPHQNQHFYTIGKRGTNGCQRGINPMENNANPSNNVYPPNNAYPPNNVNGVFGGTRVWEKPIVARSFEKWTMEQYRQPFTASEMDRVTSVFKRPEGSTLRRKTYSLQQAEDMTSEGKPVTFKDISMGDKTQKGRPWEGSGKKNRDKQDRFSPYKKPNHGILQSLTKSPREILITEKVGKTFTKPPKMVSTAKDTFKYCEFHQDYGHDTNTCRELKNQIEEAVKSKKLAYLIKEIRKGRAKQTDNQLREWQAIAVKAEPVVEGKKNKSF